MGITVSESQEMRRMEIRRESRLKTLPSDQPFMSKKPYSTSFQGIGSSKNIPEAQKLTKTMSRKEVGGYMSELKDPKKSKEIDVQNMEVQESSGGEKQRTNKVNHEPLSFEEEQMTKNSRQNIQDVGEIRATSAVRGKKIKSSKR